MATFIDCSLFLCLLGMKYALAVRQKVEILARNRFYNVEVLTNDQTLNLENQGICIGALIFSHGLTKFCCHELAITLSFLERIADIPNQLS